VRRKRVRLLDPGSGGEQLDRFLPQPIGVGLGALATGQLLGRLAFGEEPPGSLAAVLPGGQVVPRPRAALRGRAADRRAARRPPVRRAGTVWPGPRSRGDRGHVPGHRAGPHGRGRGAPPGHAGPAARRGRFLADAAARARAADPLTPREREIADLVAQALSNRDIANKLVLSERTVESHVRNILAKTGMTTRTELTRWYLRRP
jgi:DNA-binding CsgD family transcriptional regulator